MKKLFCVVAFAAAMTVFGCGPSRPPTYTASGTVTFEGTPVADGDIQFEPEDNPALRAEGGKITSGKYTVKVNPGKNKISIRASKPNPDKKSMMGEPIPEDYIPDHYNSASILQETVAPNNENRFDFVLKEKLEKK